MDIKLMPNRAGGKDRAELRSPLDGQFNEVVQDERIYGEFERYTQTKFSEEMLHFYRDVYIFRNLSDYDRGLHAQKICEEYLGYGGEEPVLNVSPRMAESANNLVRKSALVSSTVGSIPPSLFDEICCDIEQILKTIYIAFVDDECQQKKAPSRSIFPCFG
jgi:hypothetical protein